MELTLIFPHQLFADHPCLKAGRSVALIEDPLLFGTDPQWPMQVHRQRALLHRASMAAYADTLRERGFKVLHQRHHQAKRHTRTSPGFGRAGISQLSPR